MSYLSRGAALRYKIAACHPRPADLPTLLHTVRNVEAGLASAPNSASGECRGSANTSAYSVKCVVRGGCADRQRTLRGAGRAGCVRGSRASDAGARTRVRAHAVRLDPARTGRRKRVDWLLMDRRFGCSQERQAGLRPWLPELVRDRTARLRLRRRQPRDARRQRSRVPRRASVRAEPELALAASVRRVA